MICRHFFVALLEGDNTGRLLKHDPATKITTVLVDGLCFSNGVRVSQDGTFLVFVELLASRYGSLLQKPFSNFGSAQSATTILQQM